MVLALPRIMVAGLGGEILAALVDAGAFAAMVVGSLLTPDAVPANLTDLLVTMHLPEHLRRGAVGGIDPAG